MLLRARVCVRICVRAFCAKCFWCRERLCSVWMCGAFGMHAWNEIFRWQAGTLVLEISFSPPFLLLSAGALCAIMLPGVSVQTPSVFLLILLIFSQPAPASLKWDTYKLEKRTHMHWILSHRDTDRLGGGAEEVYRELLLPTGSRALSALYISLFLVFFFFFLPSCPKLLQEISKASALL